MFEKQNGHPSESLFLNQVGEAKDNTLTKQLIEYLLGASDGMAMVINTGLEFVIEWVLLCTVIYKNLFVFIHVVFSDA